MISLLLHWVVKGIHDEDSVGIFDGSVAMVRVFEPGGAGEIMIAFWLHSLDVGLAKVSYLSNHINRLI